MKSGGVITLSALVAAIVLSARLHETVHRHQGENSIDKAYAIDR